MGRGGMGTEGRDGRGGERRGGEGKGGFPKSPPLKNPRSPTAKVHRMWYDCFAAETKCPPKVPICPHSAPKPKPKFGRSLHLTVVERTTNYDHYYWFRCLFERPRDHTGLVATGRLHALTAGRTLGDLPSLSPVGSCTKSCFQYSLS